MTAFIFVSGVFAGACLCAIVFLACEIREVWSDIQPIRREAERRHREAERLVDQFENARWN